MMTADPCSLVRGSRASPGSALLRSVTSVAEWLTARPRPVKVERRGSWVRDWTACIFLVFLASTVLRPGSVDLPAATVGGHAPPPRLTLRAPIVRTRYFRTRAAYSANWTASRQLGRITMPPTLQLPGDVEVNPGPDDQPADTRPGGRRREVTAILHNVQSLRSKFGSLRASAEELASHHLIALTETWLDDGVDDAELSGSFPNHVWFRRDRGAVGGGVACGVSASMLPTRRTEPDHGSETLVLQLGTS